MGILANILAEKDRKTYNIMKSIMVLIFIDLVYTPLLNGKNFILYAWFVFTLNIAILFNLLKKRPQLVHVSDYEHFFLLKYILFFRAKLIYNIHDNFSQRYNLPKAIKKGLNILEGINVLLQTLH